ncbi:MAG: ATP-binding cassette domain-containing protein, partial [Janthinobacterium lividum]
MSTDPDPVPTTSLALNGVSMSYDHVLVLDSVTAEFTPDTVTGIIGENGTGKSTLLRLLAGVETPDEGRVVTTAEGGVGYLAQDITAPPGQSVAQVVDAALAEVRALESRQRELEAQMARPGADLDAVLAEYDVVRTAFELRGGYAAQARVEQSLAGLGLVDVARDRTLETLSGGQRSRVHLAALLAAAPEVL